MLRLKPKPWHTINTLKATKMLYLISRTLLFHPLTGQSITQTFVQNFSFKSIVLHPIRPFSIHKIHINKAELDVMYIILYYPTGVF